MGHMMWTSFLARLADSKFLARQLAKLEELGRKKLLVTFEGEIAAQRWYLLYLEDDEDSRPIARYPNAYVHKDLKIETPGSAHRHGYNSYSLILKGGYTELVDGVERTHKAGSLSILKYTQHHEIIRCEPGTVTLFMRGWRRAPWNFKLAPCSKLCEVCVPHGVCVNAVKTYPYELNAAEGGDWRMTTWFPSKTPGLERRVRVRQRAMAEGRARIYTRDEVNAQACKEKDLWR